MAVVVVLVLLASLGAGAASAQSAYAPFKTVSVPDFQAGSVTVDSTGLILVASPSGLFVYHQSGLYQGLVDLGEPLVEVVAAGDSIFASSASRTWRLQAGTVRTTAEYARVLRLSSRPLGGDLLHFRDGATNALGFLRMSTDEITIWSAPGTTVHAIPNGTHVLVSGLSEVLEYDAATNPPTLLTSVVSGVPSVVAGVAEDGSHAIVTLGGAPRRVPLPLTTITGTDLPFANSGPMHATSGSGGWQAIVGTESPGGASRLRFLRPGANAATADAQAQVAYRGAAWNPDGTMLAVLHAPAAGVLWLQLFAPPGSPRPTTAFSGAAGEYRGIAPTRVLDTRDGTGAPVGPLGPGGRVDVPITGVGDIPASGVLAVAVNITVVDPTAASYVSAFPTLGSAPFVSNVNVQPGDVRPNLAIVRIGDGGRITLLNAQGSTNVVLDVQGYFSTRVGTAGGRYHTLTPTRLLDTRNGSTLGPDGLLGLPVRNVGGVPPTATAVALTVTAVAPSAATYLTVYPSDVARPLASNLNPRRSETVANLVFARIGADGNVAVYNAAGRADVVVDVVGYWDEDRSTEAGRYIPFFTPFRYVDSRNGYGPIPAGDTVWVQVAGFPTEDPEIPLPLDGATAVVYNLTATNTTAGGYLTAFPGTQPNPPNASNLNFSAGQTVAVLALTGYGDNGRVNLYNPAGETDVIVDLAGYFTSAWF